MSIKDNVDRIRKKRKMTWSELAEATGLSRDTFMRWDRHSPSVENLRKVADALGVNATKLLSD